MQLQQKGLRPFDGDPFFIRSITKTLLCFLLLQTVAWTQEEEDSSSAWTASAGLRLMNRLSTYGVDAGPEQLTILGSAGLDHSGGFSSMFGVVTAPGAGSAWQRTDLSLGYDLTPDETWTIGLEIGRSWYPTYSTSPFRSSPLNASLSVDFDGDVLAFGASIDHYFGDTSATFLSVDVSSYIDFDGLALLPIAQLSYGSKEIAIASLKRKMGKSPQITTGGGTTTITGVTGLDLMLVTVIRLGSGWSSTITPGVSYTPSELSASNWRFSWSVGLRKAIEL